MPGAADALSSGAPTRCRLTRTLTSAGASLTCFKRKREVTKPPYYPGHTMEHKCYKVRSGDVQGQKHVLAVLDRTTTFRVEPDGTCDFTGPVRVMVMRWAQVNK